jgi:hypothetical protein
MGKYWYFLWSFGIYYANLIYFMAIRFLVVIWYISPVWVYFVKKIMASLFSSITLLTGDMAVSRPEKLVCVTDLQLQTIIRPGVSLPSFDTGARNGVLCGSQLSH